MPVLLLKEYVANALLDGLKYIFDRIKVRAVVNKLVQEVEEKYEVNSVVQHTMNRILRKLETMDPNFHRKAVIKTHPVKVTKKKVYW